jgi:hypothetical protein
MVYNLGDCRMTLPAMKEPSALIPLAMSLAALTTLLLHVALFGMARAALWTLTLQAGAALTAPAPV